MIMKMMNIDDGYVNWFQNGWRKQKPRIDVDEDHYLLTGEIRRFANDGCENQHPRKNALFVTIFFQNFSGYKCHTIFENLNKIAKEKKMK